MLWVQRLELFSQSGHPGRSDRIRFHDTASLDSLTATNWCNARFSARTLIVRAPCIVNSRFSRRFPKPNYVVVNDSSALAVGQFRLARLSGTGSRRQLTRRTVPQDG